jgi:hypothetical protein
MDSGNSKLPPAPMRRIALVQGESFRCVAIEAKPGRWMKADDGAELPRVLEIVRVLGESDVLSIRIRRR